MKFKFRIDKTSTYIDVGYITIESDNEDEASYDAYNSYDVEWENHDSRYDQVDKEITLEEKMRDD